jgi:hypothetical protein
MNDLRADTIIEYVRNLIKIPTLIEYFHDPDKTTQKIRTIQQGDSTHTSQNIRYRISIPRTIKRLIVPPDPKDELMWNDIEVRNTTPYAFIGVTGAGKTHKIFGTARYGYMLYFTADRPDEKDHTVSLLCAIISDDEGKNSAYV